MCVVNWTDGLVCEYGRECKPIGSFELWGSSKKTQILWCTWLVCSKLGLWHQLVSAWQENLVSLHGYSLEKLKKKYCCHLEFSRNDQDGLN